MGKKKYTDRIIEFAQKSVVFRSRDIEILIGDKEYAHLILHNIVGQGRLFRIVKSCYSMYNDPMLSVFCFRPAYIGLQTALSLYNLWEQETIPVIISGKKIKIGIRHILGYNVMIHRIDPSYIFGINFIEYGDFYLPVSDLEKTLLDFIYFNIKLDREVQTRILENIDSNILLKYITLYKPKTKLRIRQQLKNSSSDINLIEL